MIYKIKDEELIVYEDNLVGKEKVMNIKLEHVGLISFSKIDLKLVKTLLADKNKFSALEALMGV